ncbi:16752_t:CDS:2, partial [Racocetra persica]
YLVSIKIHGMDIMAKTQYDFDNKVIYILTWNDSDEKRQSVSSNKSASHVATLFLQLKSESQKKSRLQTLAYDIHSRIKSALNLHNFYNTKLEHVELSINELSIKLQNVDLKKFNSQVLDSIVRACNELLISHNRYYQLAAVMSEMERGYKIEKHQQEITKI